MIGRLGPVLLAGALLAGCAGTPPRPAPSPEPSAATSAASQPPRTPPIAPPPAAPGGLYAPHIKDGAPTAIPDISEIPEPVPVAEPRARYGNHSPYTVLGKRYQVLDSADGYVERGVASWYGTKFHGRPTSSYEPYDMYKFTAAHRHLPLPSYVRVTNLENGRSVIVRVNDRGPFHDERLIDLSYVAAVKLGMHLQGVARVEVRALQPAEPGTRLAVGPGAPLGPVGAGHAAARPLYLQVASFAQRDNADRLKRRLRDAGVKSVALQRAEVAGQSVWRVRLGPYADAAKLDRARAAVRKLGLGEPQTVAR